MELKKQLKGKIVFLDTAPLIYFIEGHSKYQQILSEIFTSNDNSLKKADSIKVITLDEI